jgi:glycosyltransferase involved in cell wall biosynthesis
MKILLLCTSSFSGSGKATHKISKCLENEKINYSQKFLIGNTENTSIKEKFRQKSYILKLKINSLLCKVFGKDIKEFQSLSLFKTNLSKIINQSDYDIIHLTWINEFLSIEDIGKIKKPIVWTLCDMWPIAGVSHYDKYNSNVFWSKKYFHNSKYNLDKWIINRKLKSWKNNINLVAPSQWLYECSKKSVISNNFNIKKIPWPIDTNIFKKLDKTTVRKFYNLPINRKIILFNSFSGIYNKRKGWDLFIKAINKADIDVDIMVIGNGSNKTIENQVKKKIHWMGKTENDKDLVKMINCGDLLVLPSRMDNLPQTGMEAQACGLPIVAFNSNGIKDLINHKIDGYLAEPFNPESLGNGIKWVLKKIKKNNVIINNCINKSKKNWDIKKVGKIYRKLYSNILKAI